MMTTNMCVQYVTKLKYCDMTTECQNREVRIDFQCYATTRWTQSRCNEHSRNNHKAVFNMEGPRRHLVMQRRRKHASSAIEAVFSACSCKVVIKKSSVDLNWVEFRSWQLQHGIESSFETSPYWDMSSGTEELNWIGSCRIMARKDLWG
jgi:hypothetical protein